MTAYVIKAYGPVSRRDPIVNGEYLKTYDPEAFDGRGDAVFTKDIAEAMKFANAAEAIEFSRQVPKNRRIRADGQPNRPLTAFTLEYVPHHRRD